MKRVLSSLRARVNRNLKSFKRQVMNEQEIARMLMDLRDEVHEVRLELARFRHEQRERKISSRMLTMAEACVYLNISRATMTKRLNEGEITFATKKGKSWLFPEEKLKAYACGMA